MAYRNKIPAATKRRRNPTVIAAAILSGTALMAYANSFNVPFLFDEYAAIGQNFTIRQLWNLPRVLSPPGSPSMALAGRPLVNLSLAINYAIAGYHPWAYHSFNLAIHILAAFALFGIVRRTVALRTPGTAPLHGTPLALAVALVWALHPLQTESVTCVLQRTESMAGLFYLLTLYCFIRGVSGDPERRGRFLLLSLASCVAGMATGETMVTAPLVVLLFDRTFIAGSLAAAWRERRSYYLRLASTWLLLGWLVLGGRSPGAAINFGTGLPWLSYVQAQFEAVTTYLRLAIWPSPLNLDYGIVVAGSPASAELHVLLVGLLLAATAWALVRRPAAGFIGAWFFITLAPSSLLPSGFQTIAEHRMYLPLAALATGAVFGLHSLMGRRSISILAILAVLLGFAASRRNELYGDPVALWTETVAHSPDNARAHNNLGTALGSERRMPEAIAEFQKAIALKPDFAQAQDHLGSALLSTGRTSDAILEYRAAIRSEPDFAIAHFNLGSAEAHIGMTAQAAAEYREAARCEPDNADLRRLVEDALKRLPG
jgi:tetratricopeptide (TPR) repeat protein